MIFSKVFGSKGFSDFNNKANTDDNGLTEVDYAAFVLIAEIALADEVVTTDERKLLTNLLLNTTNIDKSIVAKTVDELLEHTKTITDFQQYSRLIRDNYSTQQKQELIENLWQMAASDNDLDSIEQHIIRKIADLIYIPQKNYIRAKKLIVNG